MIISNITLYSFIFINIICSIYITMCVYVMFIISVSLLL